MGFFLCFVHIIFNRFSTSQCMVMISQMKSVPRLCQPLYNKIGWDLMIWRSWGSSKTFLLKLLTKLKIKIFPQNFNLVRQFYVPLLMFETSKYSMNFMLKLIFSTFFSFNWVQRTLKCQRITFETAIGDFFFYPPPKSRPTPIFLGDAPYIDLGVPWYVKNLFFPSLDVSFGKFKFLWFLSPCRLRYGASPFCGTLKWPKIGHLPPTEAFKGQKAFLGHFRGPQKSHSPYLSL